MVPAKGQRWARQRVQRMERPRAQGLDATKERQRALWRARMRVMCSESTKEQQRVQLKDSQKAPERAMRSENESVFETERERVLQRG